MSAEPFIPPVPMEKTRGPALIAISAIEASGRRRPVNEAAVAQMADSIDANGLITPILVRPTAEGFKLVIGAHRLAAVTLLGWAEVACDVRELDDIEAGSLEVDENLARHGLDPLDFGWFLKERKELDEQLAERAQHGGPRRGSSGQVGHLKRFTAEMADKLGRGERTIRRAIANVTALDPETIALIRGTTVAAKETNLIKLGREQNLNKRRKLAEDMVLNGTKTVEKARIALGDEPEVVEDPQKTYLGQLNRAWDQADAATRLTFLVSIDAAYLTVPASTTTTETASATPSRGGRGAGKGTPR